MQQRSPPQTPEEAQSQHPGEWGLSVECGKILSIKIHLDDFIDYFSHCSLLGYLVVIKSQIQEALRPPYMCTFKPYNSKNNFL